MFENLVGNNEIKKELENIIKTGKIANSYMFSGIEGIGKKGFAREFAKHILCLKDINCNNTCDSCKKFDAKSNPDYVEIDYGEYKKDIITIDQIREKVVNNANEKPIISNKKVYVIDNADRMNESAQNALLKTLEEPPKFVVIILIVSNDNLLLPTIKSRCVRIKFNSLSNDEIEKAIGKKTDDELEILNGSLKDYEQLNDKLEKYRQIIDLINNLKTKDLLYVLNNSDILYKNKDEIMNLLNYMNVCLLNNGMLDLISVVEKTKQKVKMNNNYEMTIDNLLIKSWKKINGKE